jgi:hypothetical protein
VIRICVICNNQYKTRPSKKRKFCSNECYWQSLRKEVRELNLVTKTCNECGKEYHAFPSQNKKYCSRKCSSKNTCFKKGRILSPKVNQKRLRNLRKKITGSGNNNWKGDDVGDSALHNWVERKLGKPNTCESCGKGGLSGRKIHWANKSGKYKRKISDWIRLCARCHGELDGTTFVKGKAPWNKIEML